MYIFLDFCINGDLISIPDEISNDIFAHAKNFIEWILDKENDHEYWMVENGEKTVCYFRGAAFVKWLNINILVESSEKASLINAKVRVEDYKNIRIINF